MPASPRSMPGPGLRGAIERASRPLLVRLTALPAAVPFLVLLGLLVLGLFVGGPVAVAATALVAVVVAWLLYLSWPRLTKVERLGRTAVLLLAVALTLVQAFPRR